MTNRSRHAALVGLALFAVSGQGWAFCRATTCDPSKKDCARDSAQCLTVGTPLYWASSCVQVYVQAAGSPLRGISFDATQESVSRAFAAWLSTDCGKGQAPLLDVQVLGPITCATSEYNKTKKNANIVMFRDSEWPYPGSEDALAFTHLQFNADTGELWDADLEINSAEYEFSTGEPVTQNDLDSMLTHEAGHLLGLAHTQVKDATMYASYVKGTDSLRTLAADDEKGICAVYAPNRVPSRTSCSPRHGFSDVCGAEQAENSGTNEGTDQEASPSGTDGISKKGCALAAAPTRSGWLPPLLSGLTVLAVCLRRRRAGRHQFVSCGRAQRQR